jgi:hypothetical protein
MNSGFRKPLVFIVFLCAGLFWSSSALATQGHGEPEGLYSHLFSHAVFVSAMVYLSYRLYRSGEFRRPGWRWIFVSAIIFSFWNVETSFVHIYRELLAPDDFSGTFYGLKQTFHAASPGDLVYYLGRFDHLLSLPALLFLLAGIRALVKQTEDVS